MTSGPKSGFRVGPDGDADRYVLGAAVASGAEGILYRGSITTATGLELDVAIKMLQPRFLPQVDEWHARWSEQVELLRSLQVPGVVRVRDGFIGPLPHSPGEAGDNRTLYLVMNWVDGKPLDEWVRRRPDRDPLDALKLLLGVAVALDLMHSGRATGGIPVVHRDVKPSNILVTDEGSVLVDFGLTRGLPDGHRTSGITGTPGYLPPEATESGTYTPATDRYALGGVAYFVLTGIEPPTSHDPEAIRSTLSDIPALAACPETIELLMAMLDTDPALRPTSLGNWIGQLRRSSLTSLPDVLAPEAPRRNPERAENSSSLRAPIPDEVRRSRRSRLRIPKSINRASARQKIVAVLLGLVVLIIGVGLWAGQGKLGEAAENRGGKLTEAASRAPSTGPGGKIAFIRRIGPEDPSPKVYVMNADGSEQAELAATTRGSALQWSPDGSRFAFSDVGGIYVMNADGSGEKRLSTDQSDAWPTWSPDSKKIAFRGFTERPAPAAAGPRADDRGGIYVMNDDGTGRKRLTSGGEAWPAWSPDGERIAFAADGDRGTNIQVINVDGSGRRTLTNLDGFSDEPAWSPDGSRIAFRHNSELWVVDADGAGPRSLVSPGGTMAVNPQGSGANKLATSGGHPTDPSWSPDSRRIAYTLLQSGQSCSIWVMNADGSGQVKITNGSNCDGDPTWQPALR